MINDQVNTFQIIIFQPKVCKIIIKRVPEIVIDYYFILNYNKCVSQRILTRKYQIAHYNHIAMTVIIYCCSHYGILLYLLPMYYILLINHYDIWANHCLLGLFFFNPHYNIK